MKSSRPARGAFSLVEMLVVIGIISILAALLLPALNKGMMKARQIQCVSRLKQVGIGFHSFANSHNSRFPMQVPRTDGGSQEFVQAGLNIKGDFYFSFRHFQVLSNELADPKILVCPADTKREAAASFAQLQNQNLSYFVAVTAKYDEPTTMLAGDRNIKDVYNGPATILRSGNLPNLKWSEEMHQFRGNILFSDGHVDETTQRKLTDLGRQFQYYPLVMPDVSPAAGGAQPTRLPPGRQTYPNYTPQPAASTPATPPSFATPQFRPQTYAANSRPEQKVAAPPQAKATPPVTPPAIQTDVAPEPDFPEDRPAASPVKPRSHYSYWGLLLLLLALLGARRLLRRKPAPKLVPTPAQPEHFGSGYM